MPLSASRSRSIRFRNTALSPTAFDAQYGRAGGGIVNLITKTGTNKIHGCLLRVQPYLRSRLATPGMRMRQIAFNSADGLATDPCRSLYPQPVWLFCRRPDRSKDKLFFFSNTEWNRIRSTGQEQFEIPTASFIASSSAATQAFFAQYGALFPNTIVGQPVAVAGFANAPLETVNKVASIDAGAGVPQNVWYTLNRFDYTYGPQASPCISVQADYTESDFPGTNSLSPYAGFDTGTTIFNQSYLYNLDVVVSNSFLSNSKVSYSRQNTNQPINGAPTPSLYLNQANTASTDGTTGTFIAFPGYLPTSPGQRLALRRSVQRLPVCAELHLTKGKHTFHLRR